MLAIGLGRFLAKTLVTFVLRMQELFATVRMLLDWLCHVVMADFTAHQMVMVMTWKRKNDNMLTVDDSIGISVTKG